MITREFSDLSHTRTCNSGRNDVLLVSFSVCTFRQAFRPTNFNQIISAAFTHVFCTQRHAAFHRLSIIVEVPRRPPLRPHDQ